MKLIPKNWDKFQQYKDRKPTWIKLHRDLLNDFSYSSVQIGTKATLPLLWLLACEYEHGEIDATLAEIAFRIHIDKDTVKVAIDELVECGFFTCVQDCTEEYKKVPREEKRRDREETEKEESVANQIVEVSQSLDDSFQLANYLYNNILDINPTYKKPNLTNWAEDIDKAIRIDGRTVEQLKDCINWIYTDEGSFWQKNILSGKKLREKFDTMNMQVMTKPKSKGDKIDHYLKNNIFDEIAKAASQELIDG